MTEPFWFYIIIIICVALWLNCPCRVNPNYDKLFKRRIENEINDMINRDKESKIRQGFKQT